MSDVREHNEDEEVTIADSGTASVDVIHVTEDGMQGDDTPERSSSLTRVRGAGSRPDVEDAEGGFKTSDSVGEGESATVDDGGADGDAGDEEDEDDDENTLEGEAEIAADYLEELLDIADLDGDIDTYIEGDRAHVSIVSDSDILVGSKGEVLDALQELTRLAVMTETGDRSRLMLDVAGFRDRRRKQLGALAATAVEQATSSQQPVPLEPMNPFERKIVHDAVAAAGLSSESEGDEPKRHVVVHPKA